MAALAGAKAVAVAAAADGLCQPPLAAAMASKPDIIGFAHLIGEVIEVITNDGRVVKGILRGCDQVNNLIIQDCCELVFSTTSGVQMAEMGLQLIRGDNVAVIGEVDEDLYDSLDLANMRAPPLRAIKH